MSLSRGLGGNSLVNSLPNNTQINGVEYFFQSTKPTTRGSGSALVIGDRWWKINDGTDWFWNGSYWLSVESVVMDFGYANDGITGGSSPGGTANFNINNTGRGSWVPAQAYFIYKSEISGFIHASNTHNASNYHQYVLSTVKDTTSTARITMDTIGIATGNSKKEYYPNVVILNDYNAFYMAATVVGSYGSNSRFTPKYFARYIAP